MVQHTYTHMGEARVLVHTRMSQPVRVWAAHTHMGCQYAYGTAHMRMGRIPLWDGTGTTA